MSDVIDRVKEQYPDYRDVPEDQLALRIAEKYPVYLDKDPAFKAQYQNAVAAGIQTSTSLAGQATGSLISTLTSPAAGEAAAMGRQEDAQARAQEAQPKDVLRAPTRMEQIAAGARKFLGMRTGFEREMINPGMGPIEGLTHQIKALDLTPKAIVEAARQFTASQLGVKPEQISPAPTDESVAQAMGQSKTAALSIGTVQGLQDMDNFFTSPLGAATLGTSAFPKLAQRMIALGFAAQMASQTPQIASQLGEEMGKPEDQRDYQRIGNLVTQAAATTGFSVMGVLHGAGPGLKNEIQAATDRIRSVAPATARALDQTQKGADAIHEKATELLQPVQPQPGESQGQVPTQGAGPEAGARSEPVIPQENQNVSDYRRYSDLLQQLKGKSLDEALPLIREVEAIKNRNGGMPPPAPEQLTHAAFIDDKGDVQLGANHPEILERLGITGFEGAESRNTPQFGFWTSEGRFVNREQAGPIATAAGQNLKSFEPGEPVHSDEVRSRQQPDQPLSEVPAETPQQQQSPVILAGAAHVSEVPETGAGGEKYGIAQAVREERARAGQVELVEPGQGITREDSIARGRQLNAEDPTLPETLLRSFESDPDRKISEKLIASVRAHGEMLARTSRAAEQRFGTNSPEYQAARDALSSWDKRTKPIQTEWHKSGQAQQSWTDLDTGSIGGLEREHRRLTDTDFSPDETKQAGDLAADVRDTEAATDDANAAINQELLNNSSPERQLETEQQGLAEAVKAANEVTEHTEAAQRALDAASKTVREAAATEATAETKERVAQAKRDVAAAKIQVEAGRRAQEATDKVVRDMAAKVAKTRRTVEARAKLNQQAKAGQDALNAAHRTVRDAAVRRAELEDKARSAATAAERKAADVQAKAARKAEDAAWKTVREAAVRLAKIEQKILADPAIPVWEKARQYLTKPDPTSMRQIPQAIRFDDLRNKIAADLGMSVDKVTQLLARSKRAKFLADDLWLKQQRERNAKTKARLWVQGLDLAGYEKFIRGIPRALFQLRVGFHGTVALGTHAPAVAFDPRFWGTYARNFGKMYHMVGSRSFFEGEMQNLLRRKNFATQVRAGLVVDPFKHEDFKYPGVTSEMAQNIQEAMAKATGMDPKWLTGIGERGYSILKVLRSDMFDQHWDNLPRQMQTEDMAKGIADAVNHITGVVKAGSPFGAEFVLFAPKLQFSRAAFLIGDPLRALRTGARLVVGGAARAVGFEGKLPVVTPAERYFAVNELKTKIYTAGTLGSLLALNQGILMMSGSKQRVNLTDPLKSDFGKFKVAGLNVSYGNPLLTMLRLPMRVGVLASGPGGKFRKLIYPDEDAAKMAWDYFRSQLSPASSLFADLVFREDYQNRQLPHSERPEPKRLLAQGTDPYTWNEYFWTQAALPIPFQELVRQTWQTGFGLSDEKRESTLHALGSTGFMMATGGRVNKDYEMEQ